MMRRRKPRIGGLVQSRIARQTGRKVSVYHNAEADLDEAGGAYSTVCEYHGWIVAHPTLRLAQAHASAPLGWCEPCAELAAGECNECGKPPMAGNESSPGVRCSNCDLHHAGAAAPGGTR